MGRTGGERRGTNRAWEGRGVPFTDLSRDELRAYRPVVQEPDDFDSLWAATLHQSRSAGGETVVAPAATTITELVVEDLTFPGFGGEPVKAWLTRPRQLRDGMPAVVEFNGYGGGRGLPGERLSWAASGYVHLFMDTRGQGSGWGSGGGTADPHGSDPSTPGFMTKGIADSLTYYYRRLFTDGVRLVDATRALSYVDPDLISLTGGSQGGGIALAVGALVPGIHAVMPDVPFLCHFRRSAELTPAAPFTEIAQYLAVHRDSVEDVFHTLSYFDGVNFARRATAPARFSVGLMDQIVLPSTVYAAYNHYAAAERQIDEYAFNGHEGGQAHQWVRQARWLAERTPPAPN